MRRTQMAAIALIAGALIHAIGGIAAPVLGYLVRRTHDPELGADPTAETFACALEGIERFDPDRGTGSAWAGSSSPMTSSSASSR